MCVTMCPPCKHSQVACRVSTCVPDIVAQYCLRTAGDILSIEQLPIPFFGPSSILSHGFVSHSCLFSLHILRHAYILKVTWMTG